MKVLLVNGSPNEKRCTYTALKEVSDSLQEENIDTELVWIDTKPIHGCIGCCKCKDNNMHCIFDNDIVNTLIDKAQRSDGYVFGSPVYFAGMNGSLKCVMDRMFYASSSALAYKPAAGIASARRAGTTLTIDQINKYFQISQMPVVSSNYWPMVHGNSVEDVEKDLEGLQTMRILGKNIAWMLKNIEAGKNTGTKMPKAEAKIKTMFADHQ